MAITCGFFNSLNGDRKYNSTQMSKLFEGILNDGVFANIGTSLVVTAYEGMSVNIGIGRAWLNHTWTDNDSVLPIALDPSEVILNRIDAVVLEVNTSEAVRANSFKIIKGTPSAEPSNPELTNTDEVKQYPLCYILVEAGVEEILGTKITNCVGIEGGIPFITGILDTVTIDGITAILNAEWDIWLAGIQGELDGDIAGNLLNLINHIFFLQAAEPASTKSQTLWFNIIGESDLEV